MTHDENIAEQFVCPRANVAPSRAATLTVKGLDKCCAPLSPSPLKNKMTVDEESFDCIHYEEGGPNEIAGGFELLQEAKHYQNLKTSLYERPDGADGCAHTHNLAELRAACVGDFDMQMSDAQMALFARVHNELDWDERRELIDALNDLERLDVDGVASDCFTYYQTLWRAGQTVLRMIYSLCCIDEEFRAHSNRYSLFCMCDTPNKCVNPQHYIHRAAHSGSRKRPFGRAGRGSGGSANIIEQTRAELTHAKDDAERQRLIAMLACLTDHLALDDNDAGTSCVDFQDDADDGSCSSSTSSFDEHTPPMTSNTSGAATPIGSNAKRKATDLIVIGGKRKRPSTPSPPAPVVPMLPPPARIYAAAACKPMASAYNTRVATWHRLVEIL